MRRGVVLTMLVMTAALSGLLLVACGSGATIPVTQQDSGSTIQAAEGDTIDLTLPENPSTGYSWKVQLSDGLTAVADAYKEGEGAGNLIGVPGTHSWQIEVGGSGTQTIKGEYRQAGNPDDNPEFFTLTVEIQ